jgi:hypothetical protein
VIKMMVAHRSEKLPKSTKSCQKRQRRRPEPGKNAPARPTPREWWPIKRHPAGSLPGGTAPGKVTWWHEQLAFETYGQRRDDNLSGFVLWHLPAFTLHVQYDFALLA